MQLQNIIGIDTRHGFRTFELYEGDLTCADAAADLLVVSAFAGSYHPTPGTLIGALATTCGVNVSELRDTCEYDLLEQFGFWISEELEAAHFRRLLCVEMVGGHLDLKEVVGNIFVGLSILECKEVQVRSLAMPMIGAGLQYVRPELVMPVLLPAAKRALERSQWLKRICFVEIDHPRVLELNEAMNNTLKRSKVVLPKYELIKNLRADLLTTVDAASTVAPTAHEALFTEMRRLLDLDSAQAFEVGILGRRPAEFVADDLLNRATTSPDLAKKIDQLAELKVANWIRSYMHTLRLLGNESAHEKPTDGRHPPYVSEEDLALCLFCANRVLSFWCQLRGMKTSAPAA